MSLVRSKVPTLSGTIDSTQPGYGDVLSAPLCREEDARMDLLPVGRLLRPAGPELGDVCPVLREDG
jgi:hypothetical protein